MIKLNTLFLLFFLYGAVLQAQVRIIPLVTQEKPGKSHRNVSGISSVSLPFWDDFSTPGQPDTNFWQNSENVFINSGLSEDPPSLYVASFDGLDANGNPYAQGSAEGVADSLTSVPIDLSSYSVSDNIYLSFFYEFAGLGDKPEPSDSLGLEFRDTTGEWVSIWPATAQDLDRSGEFRQVLIHLNRAEWLHAGFQMRFTSYGRLSGSFDLWNIDYVYMNSGRNALDTSYPDRTISEPLSNFLEPYRQIPYSHLTPEQITMPVFRVRNMVISSSNQNKAYNYYFNYSIDVTDTLGNTSKTSNSVFIEPLESPIAANSSEEVVVREPIPDFSGNEAADSARVFLEIILDADDNESISEGGDYDPGKYAPVDFQENDTLREEFIISDSYAYDDGSAELGAGLNAAGDRLAYQFTLRGVESDLLTGMDIYFPFTGSSPDGKQLELTVWQDEGGEPGLVLFRQLVNARQAAGKNEFVRYEFARPVNVTGTFYIGFRQNSPGSLAVGLDVNTTSGDRLFFNLGELWETNSLVDGSLMLRPVFTRVDDIIVSTGDALTPSVRPYPNPAASGEFYLHTREEFTITDLSGRKIPYNITDEGSRVKVKLHSPASGIYLIRSAEHSWRIIIP